MPMVSLIVPISGSCAGLRETLRSLAAQDYPEYELIVAAPHAEDIPSDALPAKVKVALGGKPGRLNLLQAGLRAARRQTKVFALAGPNGVASKFWLRALVTPLSDEAVGVSTGFRL